MSKFMWLRDFLPTATGIARISTYGYNSPFLGPNTSVSTIKDFASDLLHRIFYDRRNATVSSVAQYRWIMAHGS